ncbi:hypothetical protein Pcinc_038957 [Petrolisthes cinctipes]|uniref:Uncharacterized protein n=1 Tax=Petrolisthes cinctipes TaxID=88211 RepID=A0AAE1BPL1_PETCI|nr:hypothetical protein Pcinc_038957 [Petrolisthes cinctipes]
MLSKHWTLPPQTVVLLVVAGLALAAPSDLYSAGAPSSGGYSQVTYTADEYGGYVADVQYYGEAQYPQEYGPPITFKPQAYGPQPSYQ